MTDEEWTTAKIWTGRAHVKARPGNTELGSSIGAFVNFTAKAHSGEEFGLRVSSFLSDIEFETIEIEDIQTLDERLPYLDDEDEFVLQSRQIADIPNGIDFGSFFSYAKGEADAQRHFCAQHKAT